MAVINIENKVYYRDEIIKELKAYHQKYYLIEEGVSSNFFTGKFKFTKNPLAKKFIEYLFLEMKNDGDLKRVGTTWALANHVVKLDESLRANIDWLEKIYLDFQLQLPVIKDIESQARERKISKEDLRMFLKYLTDKKKIIKSQDTYIHTDIYSLVKEKTVQALENKPDGITLSDFRKLVACTKKIVPVFVGLLEEQKIITVKIEETFAKMLPFSEELK